MSISNQRAVFIGYILFAGVVVILDQISKQVASVLFGSPPLPPLEVLPFFYLTLVFNKGAAFGLFAEAGGWQHYFFTGLGSIVCAALVVWLWHAHKQSTLLCWGLALVLGGALGNLIDRIAYQHVIDFILLQYGNWQFPAFNIADGAITIGALILVLDSIKNDTLKQ